MAVRNRDRRSSIEVTVIDVKAVLVMLTKQLKDTGEYPKGIHHIEAYGEKWAYVETPKGLFLFDSDACTPDGSDDPISKCGRIGWPIYFLKDENSLAMFPSSKVNLTPELVKSFPTKGTVNLGKWVRKFGDRLERNFHNWNKFLEETMAEEASVK